MEWSSLGAPEWLFALVISLVSGILFGLPACWEVVRSRTRLSGTERTATRSRSALGSILMAAEVAMAFLVLAGAALLTRNFMMLLYEDQGFRTERVSTVLNIPLRSDWNKAAEFLSTQMLPALRGIPGVESIAAVNAAPLSLGPSEHSRFATRFGVAGRNFGAGNYPVAQNRWITPNYFQVLNIPLLQGRLPNEADLNKPRVIINQTLARSFFPGENPVGKHVILGVMDAQQTPNEVVGVVGDVRELGLDQDAEPTLYGIATGPIMTLLIQTASGNDQFIRDAIRRVNPDVPVPLIQPLEQNVSASLARRRFVLVLLLTFGGMAALLTGAGVYGLLAYSVNARLREFGVRAAVGAAPGELVAMILREAAVLTLPGLLAGVVLTLAFARMMRSLVYQISAVDPLSIAGAGLLLLLLIFFSAWLPARRASAVDVATALRTE
jgi:predicted permease